MTRESYMVTDGQRYVIYRIYTEYTAGERFIRATALDRLGRMIFSRVFPLSYTLGKIAVSFEHERGKWTKHISPDNMLDVEPE